MELNIMNISFLPRLLICPAKDQWLCMGPDVVLLVEEDERKNIYKYILGLPECETLNTNTRRSIN